MIYGFKQSKLDGTEYQYNHISSKLPPSFSHKQVLPKVLDQGNYPICVPCSISCYVGWKDKLNNTSTDFDTKELFKKAGGGPDGISFKDMLKYLRKNNHIGSYAKIGSIDHLKTAIIVNGPCIGGLPVWSSSEYDFWNSIYENFEGGHAISIIGYDEEGFIIRNSWGANWGEKGYAHIPYEDFSQFYEIWTLIE